VQDSHGEYPAIVRTVAKEQNVALLDLHRDSYALLTALGEQKSKGLFLILQPNESANYPQGLDDNTHFTPAGALAMAQLAVKEIEASDLELTQHLSSVKTE
jgi:lysophospholipase L1-like esterase